MSAQSDVVLVCEVCGDAVPAERELRSFSHEFGWRLSCVEGALAGGMLAMVRRDVAEGGGCMRGNCARACHGG